MMEYDRTNTVNFAEEFYKKKLYMELLRTIGKQKTRRQVLNHLILLLYV